VGQAALVLLKDAVNSPVQRTSDKPSKDNTSATNEDERYGVESHLLNPKQPHYDGAEDEPQASDYEQSGDDS
jgi:hypothetical protein